MQPPVAPTRPYVHAEHGVQRPDPYHWLKDRDDPATLAYIEAENAYTDDALAATADLKAELYAEMLGRIQETDRTAAIAKGPWAYYTRTVEGLAYTIHCREPRDGGPEQVLLDENVLADGHDFFSLGDLSVSVDHGRIAYTVDTKGDEIYTLFVVDLANGEVVDEVHGVSASVVWGNDDHTLFWSEIDATQRPWRIRQRSVPGGAVADDRIVYDDPDGRFYVWISRTRPGRYLVLSSGSAESSERWLLDGDDPFAPLRCVQPRVEGLVYDVEVAHDVLFIRTNDGDDPARRTPEFRLYTAPLTSTSRTEWVVHQESTSAFSLTDVAAFASFLVLAERQDGRVRLVVEDRATGERFSVPMADDAYVADLTSSPEYDGSAFHYVYSSMVRPSSVYRFDVPSRAANLLRQVPVPNYDPEAFHSAQLHAVSADGTRVPVSLMWKGEPTVPKGRPCLLYGYGSYGITVEPRFRSTWMSLCERGGVVAIAHIRGGGYLGRRWYEGAKFLTKQNTFSDFIAAGRFLVEQGITSREHLGIMGGSAGGMLMGGVINQAPDLCRCTIAAVPFVDVVSTMLDDTLPLTTGEYLEWGNPGDKPFFEAMLAYSPYDNVHAGPYPDLLVTSGLNDPRVQYWEPTKWVAKLRATATGSQVLLKTHLGAGHQGQSGRYGHLQDSAEELAWMWSKIA